MLKKAQISRRIVQKNILDGLLKNIKYKNREFYRCYYRILHV
jgi:hypothetical protein